MTSSNHSFVKHLIAALNEMVQYETDMSKIEEFCLTIDENNDHLVGTEQRVRLGYDLWVGDDREGGRSGFSSVAEMLKDSYEDTENKPWPIRIVFSVLN